MIRWILNLLYGSVPAEFPSQFDLSESLRKLRRVTACSFLSSPFKHVAVGQVTEGRVALYHANPLFANAFQPCFTGYFVNRDGRVVLTGQFSMRVFVKMFMTLWLGMAVLSVPLMFVQNARTHPPAQWWEPLIGLGMAGAGIAFVAVGKWAARNDVAWLTEVIGSALADESDADSDPRER